MPDLDDVTGLWDRLELPTEAIIVLVVVGLQFIVPSAISDFFGTLLVGALGFWVGRKMGKRAGAK